MNPNINFEDARQEVLPSISYAEAQCAVPGLLSPAVAARMSEWWTARPTSPLVLRDLLPAANASELLATLRAHRGWQLEHILLDDTDWPEQVDAATFAAAPKERQFNKNERLALERIVGTAATDELQSVMGSEPVLDLLSAVTGRRVVGPIVEFARYRETDFLTEHQDTFAARTIGLVLYLADAEWQPDFGGSLGYRNEAGETTVTPPTFNTMSVFPFRTDCAHWVSPVAAPGVTRYSVALHYTEDGE
jgi:Rps23 Pro-64 3,4-dihydroxylase Tpa1-like proline 4-hydroxylase